MVVDKAQFVFDRHARLLDHGFEEAVIGVSEGHILYFGVFTDNMSSLVDHRVVLQMSYEIN